MPPEATAVLLLRREITSLRHRVHDWTPGRWSARADPAGVRGSAGTALGAQPTRGDVAAALVVRLAELGRQAGTGASEGVRPPRLGDHALADQLAVVGDDLLAAPGLPEVAAAALAAVVRARTALDGTPAPADTLAVTAEV